MPVALISATCLFVYVIVAAWSLEKWEQHELAGSIRDRSESLAALGWPLVWIGIALTSGGRRHG